MKRLCPPRKRVMAATSSIMCFLCYVKTYRSEPRLLTSTMPHSNATLVSKILHLLGEHCMIVVGQEDMLCEQCYNMLVKFDHLELALKHLINTKYNLGEYTSLPDNMEAADPLSVDAEQYSTSAPIKDEPLEILSFDYALSDPSEFCSENNATYNHDQNSLTWLSLDPEHLEADSNMDKQEEAAHTPKGHYKCSKCKCRFMTTYNLKRHLESHDSAPVECAICEEMLHDRILLRQHMRVVHGQISTDRPTKRKRGAGQALGEILSTPQAESNVRTLMRKRQCPAHKYKCPKCPSLQKTTYNLKRHLERHDSGPVTCQICEATLPDRILLRHHVDDVHLLTSEDLPADQEQDSSVQSLFAPEGALQDTQPATSTNSNAQRETVAKKPKNLYHCSKCPSVQKTCANLKRHLARHNSGPVPCRVCKTLLLDRLHLRQHTRAMHVQGVNGSPADQKQDPTTPAPDMALQEVMPDSAPTSIAQRETVVKAPDRPAACPKCARLLANRSSLTRHMTRHDSRPIKCWRCSEILADNLFLQLHLLEVHKQVSVRGRTNKVQEPTARTLSDPEERLPETQPMRQTEVIDSTSADGEQDPAPVAQDAPLQEVQTDSASTSSAEQEVDQPFKCPKCARVLANKSSLTRHMTRHDSRPTKCWRCPEILADNVLLQLHLLEVHKQVSVGGRTKQESTVQLLAAAEKTLPETERLPETETNVVSDQETPARTEKTPDNPFKCDKCTATFRAAFNLKRHMERHESVPFTCTLCPEMLADRMLLRQHIQKAHLQEFQCAECQAVLPSKRMLVRHLAAHKPEDAGEPPCHPCLTCGKKLATLLALRRHETRHDRNSGPVECGECGENLANRHELRKHEKKAHGNRGKSGQRCTVCSEVFTTRWKLQRHKDTTHRANPGCRFCGKILTPLARLLLHEKNHRGQVRLQCPECPKSFMTAGGLRAHGPRHTGKFPHLCAVCGKGFLLNCTLEEHMGRHNKEARYTCEKCGRSFTYKATLNLHRMWHDNPFPYECNICSRKFKNTSHLSVHKRCAHTTDRPYKCPHCPKTYNVTSTLNKHVMSHTKKFSHRCSICGKGVTTKAYLAQHLANKHDDYTLLNSRPTPCEYKMVLRETELDPQFRKTVEEGAELGTEVSDGEDGEAVVSLDYLIGVTI